MPTPLVIAVQYVLAVPVYAALRRGRRAGWLAFAVVTPLLMATPWAIDPQARLFRFIAAILASMVFFKLLDLCLPRTPLPGWREFVAYFLNPSTLVLRRLPHERVVPRRESLRRLGLGLALTAAGAVAFVGTTHIGLGPSWSSFLVGHTARVIALYVATIGALWVIGSLLRLIVFERVRDPLGAIFTAPTPAEFWRRYNRMVGQAFHENVFRPLGGLRRPVLATLAVFVVSSILHEYVFVVPIGRIQGYQTAFFMLQGLGVAATLRIRPRRFNRPAWIACTLVFNAISSVLFFASIEQVTPFWSLQLP